jgi:hypothetical protein
VCRARYARTAEVPCAGGWNNEVTVPCTLGEPDCDAVAVCVPDPASSAGDVDDGPDASADTAHATTAETSSERAASEAITGLDAGDTSGCDGGGTGLAWPLAASLAGLVTSVALGRRRRGGR